MFPVFIFSIQSFCSSSVLQIKSRFKIRFGSSRVTQMVNRSIVKTQVCSKEHMYRLMKQANTEVVTDGHIAGQVTLYWFTTFHHQHNTCVKLWALGGTNYRTKLGKLLFTASNFLEYIFRASSRWQLKEMVLNKVGMKLAIYSSLNWTKANMVEIWKQGNKKRKSIRDDVWFWILGALKTYGDKDTNARN